MELHTRTINRPVRLAWIACLAACFVQAAEPTLADVHYGPHERHVLDFFEAATSGPAPVLIYFHGGDFREGDKRSFRNMADKYLRAGISVVSANYRFSQDAIYPAAMLDGARVVQFLRWKTEEWHVDPAKIAASGVSAGGTLAVWMATHDELAKPQSDDPVARISTRIACVSATNAATSMDPVFLDKHFGAPDFGAMLAFFGVRTREELFAVRRRKQALNASAIKHVSKEDPPVFLDYSGALTPTPLPSGAEFSVWIYHPRFGELFKEAYDRMGLECHFYHAGKPAPEGAELAFLRKILR